MSKHAHIFVVPAPVWWARALISSVIFLTVALWMIFFGGLAPTDRAEANRPEVTLPLLQMNEYAWLADPTATEQWPSKILVLRDGSGTVHVWQIPTRDDHYLMPNNKWVSASWPCRDFRPDLSKQIVACWDQPLHDWGKENYQWTFSGKNVRGALEDLPLPHAWISFKN